MVVVGLSSLALQRDLGGASAPASPARTVRAAAPADAVDPAGAPAPLGRDARAVAVPDALRGPTSDDADRPPARVADRSVWTERELREDFLRRGRVDPEGLEAEARAVLAGDARDAEQLAVLFALRELRSECAAELFLTAIREQRDAARRAGESVPSTLLVHLDRLAARDPWARAVLAEAAFGDRARPEARLRARAAASFLLRADPAELRAARAGLARERDDTVRAAALEALARNPNTDAAAPLLAAHQGADSSRGVGGHP